MAYIERETALKIIDNYANTVTEDGKVIVDAIRDIVAVITPTADVVEVVRCRDCKHFTKGMAIGMCKRIADKPIIPCHCEHYCSYGKNE